MTQIGVNMAVGIGAVALLCFLFRKPRRKGVATVTKAEHSVKAGKEAAVVGIPMTASMRSSTDAVGDGWQLNDAALAAKKAEELEAQTQEINASAQKAAELEAQKPVSESPNGVDQL